MTQIARNPRAPGHVTAGGTPEGFDARIVLRELERGAPVIHVARDDKRLAAMRAALAFFAPHAVVLDFPGWDCLPYDRVSPNAAISATRMATLAALQAGIPGPFVLLTTLNAATQRVPARALLAQASFMAAVGGRVDENALRHFLSRMGFSKAPTVLEPGDYAVRGGIIDIYPPGQSGPVRLDLFGDVLDGARRFDPATQRTTEKLDRIELAPVSEIILDEAAITRFRQNYRIEFGAAGADDPLYEAVSAGRKHSGMEHWLPFFHDHLETLFDHLPDATILLDEQIDAARLSRWEGIADQYDARREALKARAALESVYKPAPPAMLYLDDAAWDEAVAPRRLLRLNQLPQGTGPGVIDCGGRIGRNFAPERQQESISLFGALAVKEHKIDQRQAKKRLQHAQRIIAGARGVGDVKALRSRRRQIIGRIDRRIGDRAHMGEIAVLADIEDQHLGSGGRVGHHEQARGFPVAVKADAMGAKVRRRVGADKAQAVRRVRVKCIDAVARRHAFGAPVGGGDEHKSAGGVEHKVFGPRRDLDGGAGRHVGGRGRTGPSRRRRHDKGHARQCGDNDQPDSD
jgi:transcription-repair coupling factor (superfamily II helicase)